MNEILNLLRNEKNGLKKIVIMEKLNIKPRTLKSTLEEMLNFDLIRYTETNVKITEFGKHHFDQFIRKNKA